MRILLLTVLLTNYNVFATDNVIRYVDNLENKLEIPTGSLRAIIKLESNFNAKAINTNAPVVSYGVGQLTMATAKLCGLTKDTIMDYKKNLNCSAKLFKSQLVRYKNDLNKAVVAYNEGTPCICEGGIFKRNLGVTRFTCFMKKNGESIPRTCSNEGELLETKYLSLFRTIYGV